MRKTNLGTHTWKTYPLIVGPLWSCSAFMDLWDKTFNGIIEIAFPPRKHFQGLGAGARRAPLKTKGSGMRRLTKSSNGLAYAARKIRNLRWQLWITSKIVGKVIHSASRSRES